MYLNSRRGLSATGQMAGTYGVLGSIVGTAALLSAASPLALGGLAVGVPSAMLVKHSTRTMKEIDEVAENEYGLISRYEKIRRGIE